MRKRLCILDVWLKTSMPSHSAKKAENQDVERLRRAPLNRHAKQQPHVGLTKLNMNNQITHDNLLRLLSYDKETGVFTHKATRCGVKAGSVAGSIDPGHGYRRIKINERLYLAHRLAWFYVTGEWPKNDMDHIDRIRTNNAFLNLREATKSENMCNKRRYKNNRTGFKGVYWHKQHGKYAVSIQFNGKSRHVGLFTDIEMARRARAQAAAETHKQFAA